MPEPKNVLFVIIDQLRADCLFGPLAAHAHIPNLRALMAESVSFTDHYSVTAPCGPSRVSILTGQYAMNHRAVRNGTPLRHDTPNIATELRKAGHVPLLYGYTDTAQDPRVLAADDPRLKSYEEVMPGFEEVLRMRLEDNEGQWRQFLLKRGHEVPPYPGLYRPTGGRLDGPAVYIAAESDTAFMTDFVIGDLAGRAPGWLALVTYIRPHPPFVAPDPYNRMVDPDTLPPPLAVPQGPEHPFVSAARTAKDIGSGVVGFADLAATDENVQTLRAVYLGLLAEVDHHLGRLFAALKEQGRYDDTLIVVMSDHGEMLGDFGLWGKTTYHDAAFHTPLIIRAPGQASNRGASVAAAVESIDVVPTILDWLALAIPHSVDGRSLMPFIRGEVPADWRDSTFSELDFADPVSPGRVQQLLGLGTDDANLAVLRRNDDRLVHFAAGLDQILFHASRPAETSNVAEDDTRMRLMLDLSAKMLCHRMVNPDGTFSRTLIAEGGVKIGSC